MKDAFSIADLNGDGRPDIVYTTANSQAGPFVVHTLLNQGSGQFTDTPAPGLNGIGGLANVLDFNSDGIPDLVVQAVENSVIRLYSFVGKGDGTFQPVSSVTISPSAFSVYQLVIGDSTTTAFSIWPESTVKPNHRTSCTCSAMGAATLRPSRSSGHKDSVSQREISTVMAFPMSSSPIVSISYRLR